MILEIISVTADIILLIVALWIIYIYIRMR
jgi:hypothetical protein